METKSRKHVVFRANGQRQHLEVLARASKESETREESEESRKVIEDGSSRHSLQDPVPAETSRASHPPLTPQRGSSQIFHSTPLHPRPNGSWMGDLQQTSPPHLLTLKNGSLPSPGTVQDNSTAGYQRQSEAVTPSHTKQLKQSHGRISKGGRQKRNKWKKGNRIHPEFQPPCDPALQNIVSESNPPNTAVSPPYCSTTYSLQSAPGPTLPHSSIMSHNILNCSLPPLLGSQLRKGGRRPSPSVDWSSDGAAELRRCLPDGRLGVYAATWNMQQLSVLPDSLDDFLLPESQEVVSELYVVGTQESTGQHREWAVLLQQTLGPNHVFVHSASLGQLYLLMFLRRDLIWYCSEVQSVGYATRPGVMVKTKGGLGLSFSLFGTSFLFITSHFTAQQHKVQERNSDMQRISDNLTTNGIGEFDYVFWLGDLNYRVDMDRTEIDQHIRHYQQHSSWTPLLLQDQLSKEMLQGRVFQGFSEQPITFPPSYKFDLNSDTYDSSEKQRTPSWTDRILFRSKAGSGISGYSYNSCQSLQCSDHRPVYAVFNVRLEPSTETDGIPDMMADFDRDVYRIAHHRRKEVAQLSLSLREGVDGPTRTTTHTTSSVCSIL